MKLIAQIDGLVQRTQLVVTVRAQVEHFQGQIDFGKGGEDKFRGRSGPGCTLFQSTDSGISCGVKEENSGTDRTPFY
jgi:hypothetical protein